MMPKRREELEKLREQSELAAAASSRAEAAYREALDADTIAAALERAVTTLVDLTTRYALGRFDEVLRPVPWSQWPVALETIELPGPAWFAGQCLMQPRLYSENRLLESGLPKAALLRRAIPLMEPREGWPDGLPELVVVDGRSCGNPFRAECVHFVNPPAAA